MATTSGASTLLKTVVFCGSGRIDSVTPWGISQRQGSRVVSWVTNALKERSQKLGKSEMVVTHEVRPAPNNTYL